MRNPSRPILRRPAVAGATRFQAYLRTWDMKAGLTMVMPKDINKANAAFQQKHPQPRPKEHEATNDGDTTREEPTPSGEGWAPPTILLLAPNGHKQEMIFFGCQKIF